MPKCRIEIYSKNGKRLIYKEYYGGAEISLAYVIGESYTNYCNNPKTLIEKLTRITDEQIINYVEKTLDHSQETKKKIIEELMRKRDELRKWIEENPTWIIGDYRI